MLQFHSYARTRRPPQDFMARNRRAARETKPRAAPSKKPQPPLTKPPQQQARPHRVHRPQQSTSSVVKQKAAVAAKPAAHSTPVAQRTTVDHSTPGHNDTVVISKGYLEELLRMSLSERKKNVPHVDISPEQVPGLSHTEHPPLDVGKRAPLNNTTGQVPRQEPRPAAEYTFPAHHSNTSSKNRPTSPPDEAYFPFGRPGCGAPMKMCTTQPDQEHQLQLPPIKSHQTPHLDRDNFGQPGCGVPMETHMAASTDEGSHHQPPSKTTAHTHPEAPSDEGYFPFGRPGCGAPLRSASGHVIADLRKRARAYSKQDNTTTSSSRRQLSPPASSAVKLQLPKISEVTVEDVRSSGEKSSQFARGMGPHVDKYMLQERESKRQKELEHLAFLKAQIAIKEEVKRKEKEKQELEDRLEEARLERERRRLQEEHHREIERAKMKEEETKRHQAKLQQAINNATEQAAKARQEAKAKTTHIKTHRKPHPHKTTNYIPHPPTHSSNHNVTFDLESTHTISKSPSVVQGEGHYSTERQASKVSRGSRIPVRHVSRPSRPKNTERATTMAPRRQHREQVISQHNYDKDYDTQPPVPARPPSPPVPALAKKLKQQQQPEQPRQSQTYQQPEHLANDDGNTPAAAHSIVPTSLSAHAAMVTSTPAAEQPAAQKTSTHQTTSTPAQAPKDHADLARQQAVLRELAKLRQGILIHRSMVDHKATRYKNRT